MNNVIAAGDGIKLALHHWHRPPPAYGRVLVIHGHGEHMGRHAGLATQLREWGFEVMGFDLRGHGLSEGQRGGLSTHEDLLADLAVVIDRAQVVDRARRDSAGPLVLLGHGLGGLIAARFVAESLAAQPAPWHRPVDALILSSPLLDPDVAAGPLLSMVNNALPNLAVGSGTDASWRSRTAAVVAAYRADPLVHDRMTGRLRRFIVDSTRIVQTRAAEWRTPTLLLYAGKDLCTSPAGSRNFAAVAPKKITTTYHFSELFHDLFNEPERERIFALLGGWLAAWVLPSEEE
jgi:alpha-beta hydrolase superfamily lysophospholipase